MTIEKKSSLAASWSESRVTTESFSTIVLPGHYTRYIILKRRSTPLKMANWLSGPRTPERTLQHILRVSDETGELICGTVARANDRRKRRIILLREQNLRAWAENRRTVNAHLARVPLPPHARASCERREEPARMSTKNYYIFAVWCTSDEAALLLVMPYPKADSE